ncbi:MAG: hypothetical protein A3E88_07465 [Legionellales bacterium RIFCSPHIGHO2_12_FULL_35_11]|nr:MAG: hypothetical protein A3E88_07465 [Legionellales bacterium RIFCSPHIGHO2_12_FULL_35_11]
MRSSIRKFILVYLLLTVGLTATITAFLNFYLVRKEIHKHLDKIINTTTVAYKALHEKKVDHNTTIQSVIADQYKARIELEEKIALYDLIIIIFSFPISGFIIWLIIGYGIKSLENLASALANRAEYNLNPVNIHKLPKELKPVVDELNNLLSRLKEGFERETRFAADAAHELRTPLAALKAQAQVALNTIDLNEKNTALQKVIASVDRNTHIVQQLLTMSKLVPDGYNNNELSDVNLPKVAKEILALLAPDAINNHIDLEFICNEKVADFYGNATAIGILLRNLVANSINCSHPNSNVIVKVEQIKDKVVLEVIDNGPGISDEIKERVFERFFRALGNKKPGSGLGLAIVKQIADLHNAKITLSSRPNGTGLIVRVFFISKTRITGKHK